jgi:hypothetical protein
MANAEGAESLLQLVLRSRKALDHAKTLCLRAETLSSGSTQHAVDLLALDAKVTWVSDGIVEQLKVCTPPSSHGACLMSVASFCSRQNPEYPTCKDSRRSEGYS